MTTIATSDSYARQALEMAHSAAKAGVAACTCVFVSDAVSPANSSPTNSSLLEQVALPWSSSWRPQGVWCTRKLSGWRHAGILKTHALHVLLRHGWDVLIVDVDWRFVATPLPAIVQSGRDVRQEIFQTPARQRPERQRHEAGHIPTPSRPS